MPVYEYHCDDCDRDYEVLASKAGNPIVHCSGCGVTLEKSLSSFVAQTDSRTMGRRRIVVNDLPCGGKRVFRTSERSVTVAESHGTDGNFRGDIFFQNGVPDKKVEGRAIAQEIKSELGIDGDAIICY